MTPLRVRLTLKFVNESARDLVSNAKEQGDLEVVIREIAEKVNNLNISTGTNHSLISGIYALFHQQSINVHPDTATPTPQDKPISPVLESADDNGNELSGLEDGANVPESESSGEMLQSENFHSSEKQANEEDGRLDIIENGKVEIEVDDALKNFEIRLL